MFTIPFSLPDPLLDERLAGVRDVEGKIPRALQELGPILDRRVAVLGDGAVTLAERLRSMGGQVVACLPGVEVDGLAAGGSDVVVALDDGLGPMSAEADRKLAVLERALCPPGRLLVMLHYGRDDVCRLAGAAADRVSGEPQEDAAPMTSGYAALRQRDRWFLSRGFRMRVIHGWWTFDALDSAADFLGAAFGPSGAALAAGMRRPRLSYKVVIYHRSLAGPDGPAAIPCDSPAAATDRPPGPAHRERDRA